MEPTLQRIDDNLHIMRAGPEAKPAAVVVDVEAFDRIVGTMVTPDVGKLQRQIKHLEGRVVEEHEIAAELEQRLGGASHQSTRLDRHNQVHLYAGLVEDLGLKPGDMVFFVRNEAGRWEVRTEEKVTKKIQSVFADLEEE